MKKLILYALIALAGWQFYTDHYTSAKTDTPVTQQAYVPPAVPKLSPTTEKFSCDGRQYCSQMRSRAEAEYFLQNCPNTKMDGDHDGIPCENDSRF